MQAILPPIEINTSIICVACPFAKINCVIYNNILIL